MHDLKSIALIEKGICPAIARNNVTVQLDSDLVRFHTEALDQRCKRKRNRAVGKLALFPIDVKFHCERGAFRATKIVASDRLLRFAQDKFPGCSPAFEVGLNQQG